MENKWYHGRVTVLLMLFFVLGPAGFPLLWKSPYFSKRWKQILTVLTLIYTVLMIRMVVSAVTTSLRTLSSMGL
ncbi:MAG: hypothetical protein Q7J69_04240 [Candidatus Omnitrophota bacterium]|nr:hypothetical protein [Candidatus Omnitrophota bacterium]